MSLRTQRIKSGHYRYDHATLGRFTIKKIKERSFYYESNYWKVWLEPKPEAVEKFDLDFKGNTLSSHKMRRKKDCVRWIKTRIEHFTDEKVKEKKAPASQSQRTFEARHYTSAAIRKELPFRSNGCVPIAFARALSYGEEVSDKDLGELAAIVAEELDTVDSKGTHMGSLSRSAKKVGIDHVRIDAEPKSREYHRNKRWPTVAQFLRNNPDIKAAVIRTTGHAGYYEDGEAYGLGARMRVDHALIIDREE